MSSGACTSSTLDVQAPEAAARIPRSALHGTCSGGLGPPARAGGLQREPSR